MKNTKKKAMARRPKNNVQIHDYYITDRGRNVEVVGEGHLSRESVKARNAKQPTRKKALKSRPLPAVIPRTLKTANIASLIRAGNQNSTGVGDSEATQLLSGSETAQKWFLGMTDPFQASQLRAPDQFTLIPTSTVNDYVAHCPTIYNGTSASDGSAAFVLRGEGKNILGQPASIDASSNITWTGISYSDLLGAPPPSVMSRPTAVGFKITFNGVGAEHSIRANLMETPPYPSLSSGFNNWPTVTDTTPNTIQREIFAARTQNLKSGEAIQLTCFPSSSHEFTQFSTHTAERGAGAFNGYIIWLYGLNSTDSLTLEMKVHYEYYNPYSSSTAPTSQAVVKAAGESGPKAMSAMVDFVATGANVMSGPSGGIGNAIKAIAAKAGGWEGLWDKGSKIASNLSSIVNLASKAVAVPMYHPQPVRKWFGLDPVALFSKRAHPISSAESSSRRPLVEEHKEPFPDDYVDTACDTPRSAVAADRPARGSSALPPSRRN